MGEKSLYKNLVFFLISIVLINFSIGFYKSITSNSKKKSEKINFSILNKNIQDFNNQNSNLEFIVEANEMIDIFKKYNFSVDSFLNDSPSNLIIFSSLPKDFMKIEPIKERKNLFINTLIPIIFIENKKILSDRKKILEWWRESEGDVYSRDFWPLWFLN